MSQTIAETPRIPASFTRTPINPHTEKVKQGLAQMAGEQPAAPGAVPAPGDVTTQPMPQPMPQPVDPVPPAAVQRIVHPSAPTQQIVQTAPVQPAYPPAPPAPVIDPYLVQQLAQDRDRIAAEMAEKDKVISNLLASQKELDQLKQQQQLQAALASTSFEDLETVDPNDAKRISAAVLATIPAVLTPIQKAMEEQRKDLEARAFAQQQQYADQRAQIFNQQVLSAHPDFHQLQRHPAYHAFMTQRDGLSMKTRDQRAAEELAAGNPAYVIDLLNQLKGQIPSAGQISTVAPVQAAASGAPAAAPQAPPMTLRDLNNLMQMRQITPEEYSAKLKELRAAPAANNVI